MSIYDIIEGRNPRRSPRVIYSAVAGLVVLLLVLLAMTSFHRVDASEEGVVLRFGQHVRTVDPGLHLKMPWPVEQAFRVPVQRIETLEFGFATAQAGRVTQYAPRSEEQEEIAEMLTGDLNLAHVEWIVQYRIADPVKGLFSLGGVSGTMWSNFDPDAQSVFNPAVADTIRDVSESVVRSLVGDGSVDEVLTMGRDQIASDAKRDIQAMLDRYHAGVEIITVRLQSTAPPDPVKDAFQEVNRARQNKERVVNEAEGERNRQIPAARGAREKAIAEAEGYESRMLLETQGSVNAFLAKLEEYEKAPEVTRRRLYLEAMQEVLQNVGEKTVIDASVKDGVLPLLNLDRSSNLPLKSGAQR